MRILRPEKKLIWYYLGASCLDMSDECEAFPLLGFGLQCRGAWLENSAGQGKGDFAAFGSQNC